MYGKDTHNRNDPNDSLSIEVERQDGSVLVRLVGSCAMDTSERLTESMLKLASKPASLIIVDMSALEFIESTGLGGLVAAYLRCCRQNGEIRLVAPQPHVMHVLKVTRLIQLFHVFDSIDEAMSC